MSDARVKGYALYEYDEDKVMSNFGWMYERKQDALLALGMLRGAGKDGFISRVVEVTEEREERLNV